MEAALENQAVEPAARTRLERSTHASFAAFAAACIAGGAIAGDVDDDGPTTRWLIGAGVTLVAMLLFGTYAWRLYGRVPPVGKGAFLVAYGGPHVGEGIHDALVDPPANLAAALWLVVLLFAVVRRSASFRNARLQPLEES